MLWTANRLSSLSENGGSASGEYCATLTATDVFSGWTELRALRNRAHRWVKEEVVDIRSQLPFSLLGVDSDNGAEFINKTLLNYCNDTGVTFTRERPYRKNDNCLVEKIRTGPRVKKVYEVPKPPYQRMLD